MLSGSKIRIDKYKDIKSVFFIIAFVHICVMKLHREYSHLLFKNSMGIIRAINNTPIMPHYYDELMLLAFKKRCASYNCDRRGNIIR